MIEDKKFNAYLKAKLEEDIAVPPIPLMRCSGIRANKTPFAKPQWRHLVPIAAAVIIICGIFCRITAIEKYELNERHTEQVIVFLCEAEALAEESAPLTCVTASSLAEKLLAWQDTPFIEIAE